MLTCSQVARSIASDEYRTGGFLHRVTVRMHLAMCRHCSRYFRQLREIARVFRTMGIEDSVSEIQSAQARIVARLSQEPQSSNFL
jgi:predicted anti-sigma-YlaC factor YlaD